MGFPRRAGILLPITSLPSPYGVGDMGPGAFKFIDFLKETRQYLWQILPFSMADDGGSPYSSLSAYGGYPLLISMDKLIEDGLLKKSELIDMESSFGTTVQYDLVQEYKTYYFHLAFERLSSKKKLQTEFFNFCKEEAAWIHDLAQFIVLVEQFGGYWPSWPHNYRYRDQAALQKFVDANLEQINYHKFLQFIFFRQWHDLKKYANENHIQMIGDIPIFLSHCSMDVWRNPELFKLASHEPYVVTGAPPDNFSATGQKWGNPNYNWWQMEQDGFDWWTKRMAFMIKHYDIVRLDHFRGFAATWEIPEKNPDPRSGYWSFVPGHNLFHCLSEKLGPLPVIAEDLGKITPDVLELRDRFQYPGMKILQFAFDEGDYDENLPHNFTTNNCVVYTGTHDNGTTKGWFSEANLLERDYCTKYTNAWNWDNIHWSLISLALHSRADTAIIPLQDVMGLGNEARFNTPGTSKGNWGWRFRFEDIKAWDKEHLARLTVESGRA